MSWGGGGIHTVFLRKPKVEVLQKGLKLAGGLAVWLERLPQVPSLSLRDAGSTLAGNNSFVVGARYQRMEMTLVRSFHRLVIE